MINIIHTADIHFGMENYGRVDPITGIHSRLLDFKKALDFCVDYAIEQNVDAFVFAGDAYKTTNPSPTQQRLLFSCLIRLVHAKIPVVLVIGNHDNPLSFGKAHALDIFGQVPIEGFHVVSKPQNIRLETKSGPLNILGIPWPTRNTIALSKQHTYTSSTQLAHHISECVSNIIRAYAQELEPDVPAMLVGHLTVSNGIFSGSEKRAIYGNDPTFMPSQLAIPPFDYVALGHLHRHQNLNPSGNVPIVYAGSIERIDFGERKEPKGFCHVTIGAKGKATYKHVETPTRPFLQFDIVLQESMNQTQQILMALKEKPIHDAVVKIVYHVPQGKKDMVDLPTLQQALAQAWHCAGIIPVYTPITRDRRIPMKIDMSLETLLATYFSHKKTDQKKQEKLIEKTLELYREISLQESELQE